jgi:hypothetical protein
MESKWEQIDVASIKGLQSISSLVAGFTLSSYSDIEFYLEVGSVEDIKTVKKDQIEKDGVVYERMHNNLFAFAFAVNRVYNELVTKAQSIAYIPSNENDEDPEFGDDEQDGGTVISLWCVIMFTINFLRSRVGFFRSEVSSIPIQVARELSRPFFWHLYHRVARRKLRSYIFLVKSIAQILRCVDLFAKLILFLDTHKKR